jgi:hypothetical protein
VPDESPGAVDDPESIPTSIEQDMCAWQVPMRYLDGHVSRHRLKRKSPPIGGL